MKKLNPTSTHFLTQKFWRYSRKIIRRELWTFFYTLNQKIKFNGLKKIILKNDLSLKQNLISKFNINKEYQIPKENKLSEILLKNKSVKPPGKYLEFLDEEIKKIPKKNNFILEIGIAHGNGLISLREFFYGSKIVGLDIDPATFIKEDRIDCYEFDQLNLEKSKKIMETINYSFDLIIDDGWHQPEAQIKTLVACLPYLSSNGIYIVEDIVMRDYKKIFYEISKILELKKFKCKLYDFVPKVKINNYGMTGVLKITRS